MHDKYGRRDRLYDFGIGNKSKSVWLEAFVKKKCLIGLFIYFLWNKNCCENELFDVHLMCGS
jgi:hypothetical protein